MKLRQVVVGTFYVGHEQVQLVLREGDGGEFWVTPERGSLPRIKIGADGEWKQVITRLLHEVLEFVLARSHARFEPSEDLSRDHAAYLFVLDHPTFSDWCARVSDFLSDAVPKLSAAWAEWKRPRKPDAGRKTRKGRRA